MGFNNAIKLDEQTFAIEGGTPVRLKKITGTRLSKILDCNHWATPFAAWCEIMKAAEPPFEGNKYTEAGQAIEPKLIDYCKDIVSPFIVTPTEYFKGKTKVYDFFPENKTFGGMWDALAFDRDGVTVDDDVSPIAVIEAKTTSRPQDWENGVPDNYKIQGMMYAALIGCDDVYFPVAFLQPRDYDDPTTFECTDENTRVFHVSVWDSVGRFENIFEALHVATEWWNDHIEGNCSPAFDERRDKDYLEILNTVKMSDLKIDATDIDALCTALYEVDTVIEALEQQVGLEEWREKRKAISSNLNALVKDVMGGENDITKVDTKHYVFTLSQTRKVDYNALERDGLYDKYVSVTTNVKAKKK